MPTPNNSFFLIRILLPVISIVLLQACSIGGGSGESPTHEFSLDEVDGVQTAVTKGGPKYTAPLFEYEELFRLEQDESRVETLLAGTMGLRMDEEGYIYVNDSGNNRVAVFDPDGRYSHSIGRQGAGPGEFEYPRLLHVGDGIVTVDDNRLLRTSIFKTDGEYIRSNTYPRLTPRPPIFYTTMSAYPGPEDHTILNQQGSLQIDTVPGVCFRVCVISSEREVLSEITSTPSHHPGEFEGLPMAHYKPGAGILVSEISEPILRFYNLDCELQKEIRVELDRGKVTADERASVTEQLEERLVGADNDRDRERAQRQLDDLSFPEFKDYWMGIGVDEFGYIWASEPDARSFSPTGETRYRILSPDGEYMGDTYYPDIGIADYSGTPSHGHLLCAYEDEETGAPMVVVLMIKSAIRGFEYR